MGHEEIKLVILTITFFCISMIFMYGLMIKDEEDNK